MRPEELMEERNPAGPDGVGDGNLVFFPGMSSVTTVCGQCVQRLMAKE